jgi:hypothetical protein
MAVIMLLRTICNIGTLYHESTTYKKMKLLPFHQIVIKPRVTSSEVTSLILENSVADAFGKTHSDTKKFIGTANEAGFKIKNSLSRFYENSFNPIAIGIISKQTNCYKIEVNIRPSIPTLLFMFFWFAYFIKGLNTHMVNHGTIEWILIGFILFGYLLMYFAFWAEAPKLERRIRHLLEQNQSGS